MEFKVNGKSLPLTAITNAKASMGAVCVVINCLSVADRATSVLDNFLSGLSYLSDNCELCCKLLVVSAQTSKHGVATWAVPWR